jgi:5-methylcytosine-specific restriction endonuclease McrA
MITCGYCLKEHRPKRADRQTYCSRDCSFAAKKRDASENAIIRKAARATARQASLIDIICSVCSTTFQSHQPAALYCSPACRTQVGCERRTQRDRSPRQCRECEAMFAPAYGDKHRVFCSDFCFTRNAHRINRKVGRAKRHGSPIVEPIDPLSIFRRDNWQCQSCGTDTPRDLTGTSQPDSPEMDHILALSNGGTHEATNLQCLCRRCNLDKAYGEDRSIAA